MTEDGFGMRVVSGTPFQPAQGCPILANPGASRKLLVITSPVRPGRVAAFQTAPGSSTTSLERTNVVVEPP